LGDKKKAVNAAGHPSDFAAFFLQGKLGKYAIGE
jgi:hypothetical protein